MNTFSVKIYFKKKIYFEIILKKDKSLFGVNSTFTTVNQCKYIYGSEGQRIRNKEYTEVFPVENECSYTNKGT